MSVQRYYSEYWTEHGYRPARDSTPDHLAELFDSHVHGACLDVGCGDGGTSGLYLAGRGHAYTGVDVSPTAVELARQRGLDAQVIETAEELPFEDESFDSVLFIEVLEHLFRPDEAAREARRVLRPGGKLVATVPNASHWRDRIDMLAGRWHPRGDDLGADEPWRSPHVRFFRPKVLEQMLRSVGFREVETGGVTAFPLSAHVPGYRRVARRETPSAAYRALTERFPSLLAPQCYAVATK